MLFKPKLSFSDFQKLVGKKFRLGFREADYKELVGKQARLYRDDIYPERRRPNKISWPDWMAAARIGIDEISWSRIGSFSENTIGDLVKADASILFAYAIHYRMHMYTSDRERGFADEVDTKVFEKPLRQLGLVVFERVAVALKPTAPFRWPDHVSEEDVRREDAPEGIWLNPHNHHSIPLSGRKREWKLVTDFIDDKRHFLIGALVAPSGAGKTRLISEWMKGYMAKYNDNGWDAGFVDSRDIEPWREENWQPKNNTLVIIDYTYNYDRVIETIFRRFEQGASRRIRVLLLDHVAPRFDAMHADITFQRTFPDAGDMDGKNHTFFRPYPIVLEPETDESGLMRDVIACAADPLKKKGYNRNSPIVVGAAAALMAVGNFTDKNPTDDQIRRRDSVRHPLFAALGGQVLGENPDEEFTGWSRRDLISRYFERGQRIPWIKDDRNQYADTLGPWVGCCVTAATLLRGVSITHMRDSLPQSIRNNSSALNFKYIVDLANRIVSSNDSRILKPLEPDILGEAFLLKFIEAFAANDTVMSTLATMIGSERNLDRARKNAAAFVETIQRLARNLANDNQKDKAVAHAWTALLDLLKPGRFEKDSAARHAISIALVAVAEVLPKSEMVEEYQDCLEQVIPSDLLKCADTSLYREATISLFKFHDMADETVLSGTGCNDEMLLTAARCFESRTTYGWSALMLVCCFGKTAIVQHLLNEGAKIEKETGDGVTGFMLACQNGHEGVVSLLLDKAEIDKVPKDGGTGFMRACKNGHEGVVALLIDRAEIDKATKDGFTGLMAACQKGRIAVVKILLNTGKIDPNAIYIPLRASALMFAVVFGHKEIVELILRDMADPNLISKSDGTALDMAIRQNYDDIACLLRRYHAKTEDELRHIA